MPSNGNNRAGNVLITAAAMVIVIAGMREAQTLLVPFLLAAFIAIIVMPAVQFLEARRVPTFAAILLVILLILGAGVLLGGLVGRSADDFSAQLPVYQEKFAQMLQRLQAWLNNYGLLLTEQTMNHLLDPNKAMTMAAQGISSLSSLLTNAFLILLTVLFILFEAACFPAKLRLILPDPTSDLRHIDRMLRDIKHYMAIKTFTSLLTGFIVFLMLWALGVDFPLLWGMMAFFLNYVPNIGSLIAAIPPILLALVQLGTGTALWTMIGYLLVNNLVGNVIEPRFMGRGLGLSTLVVFVSLVFWGWVLGLIGMFLSVPLTMTLKIALDSREDTRWIAILLGPEIDPDEPIASTLPKPPTDNT